MEQVKVIDKKIRVLKLLKRVVELIKSKDEMDRLVAQALVVEAAKQINKI